MIPLNFDQIVLRSSNEKVFCTHCAHGCRSKLVTTHAETVESCDGMVLSKNLPKANIYR